MTTEEAPAEAAGATARADEALMADLRLRLQGSQEQALAARHEARVAARELALAHRLLKYAFNDANGPVLKRSGDGTAFRAADTDSEPAAGVAGFVSVAEAPRVGPTRLLEPVMYHFDNFQNDGAHTLVSGWAFRPAPGWNGLNTTVTLLLSDGETAYYVATGRVRRPDVAEYFAAQAAELCGGAEGLEGIGFACEILHDALPPGTEWEVTLRLECAGAACEQPTAHWLRS